jgi:hypothetical protein
LSTDIYGWNTLHTITTYYQNKIGLVNKCFFATWNRSEKYFLMKEDIQQYNLVGDLFSNNNSNNSDNSDNSNNSNNSNNNNNNNNRYFLEKRFQYFVDWDPMALSIPCQSEYGICLPIHYSTLNANIYL